MTPPSASVQSAPHAIHPQHAGEATLNHAGSDHFADRHWTSDANDSNSVWSAASYWVRRKRAESVADLGS